MADRPRFQILIVPETGEEEIIFVDGTLREVHTESSIASMFPVGRGRDTTDHLQDQPSSLSVEIIVTESPLRALEVEQVSDYDVTESSLSFRDQDVENIGPTRALSAFERSRALFERLDALRKEGALLTVTTALRQSGSMAITGISAPVEGSQQSVTFAVDFLQIRIADSEETLDVEVPRLNREEDAGNENGTDEGTEAEVVPRSGLQALRGLLF